MAIKKKTAASKAATKTGKQLPAKASKQELATAPTVNLEDDAGLGQENMGSEDFAIPRLSILQDLSPQVKKTEDGYIDGAEAGDIIDLVSESLHDGTEGIQVVPCAYRRSHIEWGLRENGGGFINDHGAEGAALLSSCKKDDRGRLILPSGNQLVATAEYYLLVIGEDGSFSPYVCSMTSTQLKASRKWNTMINQLRIPKQDGSGTFNPAMFYLSYNMSTVPQRNDQGSWFGWKIAPSASVLDLDDGNEIYLAARALRESVQSGELKAAKPISDSSVEDDDAPM